MKNKKRIIIIYATVLIIVVLLNYQFDITKSKIGMLSSDTVTIINERTSEEYLVKYSDLFGDDRGEIFYTSSQLEVKLSEWRKDYTLIFYKNGERQAKLTIYTIDGEKSVSYQLIPTELMSSNPSFYTLNNRSVVARLEGFFMFKRSRYTMLNQNALSNLERIMP